MAAKKMDVKQVAVEDEFRRCPECGYNNGFHNMFKAAKGNGHIKWYLICPNCAGVFDVGLTFANYKH